MKDTKHIQRDFHSVAWVMPQRVGLWGARFAELVMCILSPEWNPEVWKAYEIRYSNHFIQQQKKKDNLMMFYNSDCWT